MDMLNLCCILFSRSDPKKLVPDLRSPTARSGPETQDVAVFPADDDAICCVPPPRDLPLTTGKRRFAYSLTVVHFRKVVIRKKSDLPETAIR
jgi:hypothetical protein